MDQEVRRDTALGHLLVVPLGNISLRVWISMTSRDWRPSSHKGQWCFTTKASHAAALYLSGIATVCPEQMRESTRMGVALDT
jgi:hypothetical protein